MTNKFDFDTEKLVQPNNKADVKQFKADLETIAKGNLDIAKGKQDLLETVKQYRDKEKGC